MTRLTQVSCCTFWPDPPPATTSRQEAANRYLATWEGIIGGPLLVPVLAAVILASALLPERLDRLPMALFFLAVGVGCAIRFLRCRTAHCGVTALLAPLGVVTLVDVALGTNWLDGNEGLVALGLLVVGFTFEGIWALTHDGRTEVRSGQSVRSP